MQKCLCIRRILPGSADRDMTNNRFTPNDGNLSNNRFTISLTKAEFDLIQRQFLEEIDEMLDKIRTRRKEKWVEEVNQTKLL